MPVTYVYDGAVFQPISGIPGSKGDQGDTGPAGPSEVSADPGNQSVLGSDSLIYTPEFANGVYLPLAGGVMSGFLTLNADPILPAHAATKQYVDGFLPLTGGVLTGPLLVPGNGTFDPVTLAFAVSTTGFSATGTGSVINVSLLGIKAMGIQEDGVYLYSAGTSILQTTSTQVRGPDGTEANPGWSFQTDSDTGMRRRTTNALAFAGGGVDALWVDGSNGVYIRIAQSTGSAANAFLDGSNLIWKSTSARKYKSQITYDVSELLDIELKPAKFWRDDDKRWFYGQIADDLEAEDEIFAQYGEDGELENYDSDVVLAVVIAQLNDARARLEVAGL